ncbi:MAG: sensor histidine kinase [Anaerolineaceae bacterium]|nr:sensor histidine kinase [Anaerolineaceae bacterium]
MQKNQLDASLLSVFRLFVGIRLAFTALTLLASSWFGPRFTRFEAVPVLSVLDAAFLLAYLSWPWLRRKFGPAYLPVALLIATVGPILENFYILDLQVNTAEIIQVRALAGQWQVIILLLVPVILIAWQYSFRTVVVSLLSLAAVDMTLIASIGSSSEMRLGPGLSIVFFRTLIFLLIGYTINRLAAELRMQNSRLAQANQQLASNANTVEQLTISRERNRMARELHDTLAHSLSAVAVQLEAASALWESDGQQARAMVDRSLHLTRDGLNEARRAIQALRTAPLEDLGLNLALRTLALSEAERGGYAVQLDLPDEMPRIDPGAEHSLYRIAEEALRNAAWHSSAAHVSLRMALTAGLLEMTIEDDGCGFVDGAVLQAEHYGLRGMRERAEALGAEFKIITKPDQGTSIHLVMEANYGQSPDM